MRARRWAVLAVLGALCALAALPAAGQAAPGGDAIVEATNVVVPNNATGSASAICPAGTRAVGGGVSSTGPVTGGTALDDVVQVSGPMDETGSFASTDTGDVARRWYASVFNRSGAPRLFKVFALCSADSDATVVATAVTLAGQSSGPAVPVACPAGARLTGGGLGSAVLPGDNLGLPVLNLQFSGPLSQPVGAPVDGDVGRLWFAWVRNDGVAPQSIRVFALCSQASDATLEVQDFVVPNAGSVAATATCPAGRRVLGGGLNGSGTLGAGPDFFLQLAGPQDATGLPANTDDGDVARSFAAYVQNVSGSVRAFGVVAVCATDAAAGPGPGGPGTGEPPGPGGPAAGAPRCLGRRATIVGTPRRDVLRGTSRADVIVALGGNDVIAGRGGNDLICAGAGDDRVTGGLGADRVSGGPGDDRIAGGLGADRVSGGPGDDRIAGGLGADRLAGGGGRDVLLGGAGVDTLLGGLGADVLLGGAGRDALAGGPGRDRQVQ